MDHITWKYLIFTAELHICRDSADTQYMLIQISENLQNS